MHTTRLHDLELGRTTTHESVEAAKAHYEKHGDASGGEWRRESMDEYEVHTFGDHEDREFYALVWDRKDDYRVRNDFCIEF